MDNFRNSYTVQFRLKSEDRPEVLSDSSAGRCRFCLRSSPEVSFLKQAHVLPRMFGNKHILSSFECDACNNRFSEFESHLANFLGPLLTVWGVKGRDRIPEYHRKQKGLKSKRLGNTLTLSMTGRYDMSELDFKDNALVQKIPKDSYIPCNVFRALLHPAFCMLAESELSNFEILRRWLNNESVSYLQIIGARINISTLKDRGLATSIQLHRKKLFDNSLYSKFVLIGFERFLIEFPIADDFQCTQAAKGSKLLAPAYPTHPSNSSIKQYELTSSKKKTDDFVAITFVLSDAGVKKMLQQEGSDDILVPGIITD